jgi:hypothetical protein
LRDVKLAFLGRSTWWALNGHSEKETIAVEADLFQEALPAGRLHRRGSTTALSISRRRIFNR